MTRMNPIVWLLLAVVVLVAFAVTGCAPRGRALRPTLGKVQDPPSTVKPADAWYIETTPQPGRQPVSCSFVEFDERGDYLDFAQHRHAYTKIRRLASERDPVLVFMYVHGWKNNSQSSDVVEFNNFLTRLAGAGFVKDGGYRVHGVYLAWRGNSVPHAFDNKSELSTNTFAAFGGESIVNTRYARNLDFLYWLPEQLSYWSRKNAAEDKVSGLSLVRTMFTCAHTAKRFNTATKTNRVFLMGHSMGALMLEQSFAPAILPRLTEEWPWNDEMNTVVARANPLPYDLVLLVNSAAPSIYAKQFFGYMVAHRQALINAEVTGADAPIVISLTTKADTATGKAHPLGNAFARFYPSLWRNYDGSDFILDRATATNDIQIPQHYYYRKTPGHNPLLVNHWIVPAKEERAPAPDQSIFQQNMQSDKARNVPDFTFFTSPRRPTGKPRQWEITTSPHPPDWSTYKGHRPVAVTPKAARSGYWIVRCEKEIMSGHNDIWSQQAMETYAALFSLAERLRLAPPKQKVD